MIALEHVNIVVKDINATLDFIQTAFPDWKIRGKGENEWYGKLRDWLHVGTDDYYISVNGAGEGQNRDLKGHTPGLAHIGFSVDDIDGISERLQNKGYEIAIIGAEHPHRKNIYFIDPAGFEFEFIQYLSEEPKERNMYGGEVSEIVRVSTADKKTLVENLYRVVDNKSVKDLSVFLSENIYFCIANHDPVNGKAAVLKANKDFFSSVSRMTHHINSIWEQDDDVICNGSVDYVRLDGSELTVPFATILKFQNSKIVNYQVYVDISQL